MTTKTTEGGFDQLLESIAAVGEDMNKALDDKAAGDDAAIAAAAGADAAAAAGADAATDAAAGGEGGEGAEGGDDMTKALTYTDEHGVEHQAVDATELLKSLVDGQKEFGAQTQKAFGAILGVVKQQGEMIKSLVAETKRLGAQGVQRKATVVVNAKPAGAVEAAAAAAAGAEDGGISVDEFWGKCFEAQANGDINAADISKIESEINHGRQPPADLLARIKRSTDKK